MPRMHLTPRDRERLLLAAAADLARRRLARGAPLGATEAVALVCDEICEMAWDGAGLAEVIDRARSVVAPSALLPGVAGLVPVLEVEALFPWGTTLVHVDEPFGPPAPGPAVSQARHPGGREDRGGTERVRQAPRPPDDTGSRYRPGAVLAGAGDIELVAGAERRAVVLRNAGARDVWISSHFPLDQLNPAVEVTFNEADREAGTARRAGAGRLAGWRLDLPAGEALPLRAGEDREVTVVAMNGWTGG